MALKLYGCVDLPTGIEFMVRAKTRLGAQETAEGLLDEINTAGSLFADDFEGPIEITTTYHADNFLTNGSINGGTSEIIKKIVTDYIALRLDGIDDSYAFTENTEGNRPGGDQEIVAFIQFDVYQGAGIQSIVNQWGPTASGDSSFFLRANEGALEYGISSTGSVTELTSLNFNPEAGAGFWVKGTFKAAGAQPGTQRVSISTQNQFVAIEDLTFDSMQDDVTSIVSLNTTDEGIHVGAISDLGTSNFIDVPVGFIGRVALYDGIIGAGGILVSNMFPDQDTSAGETSWNSTSTEETWSLFGNADIGVPILGGPIKTIKLDGTPGTYVSAPDDTERNSSFTVAAWIQSDSLIDPSPKTVVSKFDNVEDASWIFDIADGDDIAVHIGTDLIDVKGSSGLYRNGEGIWTAVFFDIPNTRVYFYRSKDCARIDYKDIEWVEVGCQIVPNLTVVKNSLSDILVGPQFAGNIARVLYMEGKLTGDLYREMNPDRDYIEGDSFTSYTTGEEWTLNGDSVIGTLA